MTNGENDLSKALREAVEAAIGPGLRPGGHVDSGLAIEDGTEQGKIGRAHV